MAKTRLYEEILKTSENVLNGLSNVNNAFIELFKQSLRVNDNSFLKIFKTDKAFVEYLSNLETENVLVKKVLGSFALFSISFNTGMFYF